MIVSIASIITALLLTAFVFVISTAGSDGAVFIYAVIGMCVHFGLIVWLFGAGFGLLVERLYERRCARKQVRESA